MFQPGQQVTVIDGGWTGIIVQIDTELQAAYIQFPGRPDKLAYAFEAIAPAGRDDTQDTRDNPRAAGAASDRGAQPSGQQVCTDCGQPICWTVDHWHHLTPLAVLRCPGSDTVTVEPAPPVHNAVTF